MAKQRLKATDLKGFNIFHDPKKGTVVYDFITKNGYILTSQDVANFNIGTAIFPIAILLYFVLAFFKLSVPVCIIGSLVVYIVGKILHRILFLYKLPVIENYQKPKEEKGYIARKAEELSFTRIYILIFLTVALVIACIVNVIINKFEGFELIAYYLLILASILMFIYSLVVFFTKKKSMK